MGKTKTKCKLLCKLNKKQIPFFDPNQKPFFRLLLSRVARVCFWSLFLTNFIDKFLIEIMSGKKRKLPEGEEEDYVAKPPRILANIHLRNQEKRLIIVLEQAQLESAKVFLLFHGLCIFS